MSDSKRQFGGLQDYYKEFVPTHFPLASGKPRSRRSAAALAERHNLPLVRMGHISYIDPELAAQQLREDQLFGRAPYRGPGRPRKV
jgi:hypothetical protein